MTALEEVTERFHQALAAQEQAEDVLNKAARDYGVAKAAAELVTKLGGVLNTLTELEPKEEADDNDQTTEL